MTVDTRSHALWLLSRFLVTDLSLEETLGRVADLAVAAIPAVAIAGVSMLDEDSLVKAGAATGRASAEIDAAQYASGRGPGVDAWRRQHVVGIDDMAANLARYPRFAAAALADGMYSSLSLPLLVAGRSIGVVSLYCTELCGFTGTDEGIAVEIAAAASVVLANSCAYWDALRLSERLTEGMSGQAVIEQAKGVIMSATGGSADDASASLRRQSRGQQRKVGDIAAEILRRQVRPEA